MILVYAGRRAQSLADTDEVGRMIARRLAELRPSATVGALADGADLLLVEAALALPDGPDVHIVLPTPLAVFRASSVEPGWRERFDRAIRAAGQRGSVRSLGLADGSDAYRQGNVAFLDEAARLAGAGEVRVLVVARPGEGEMVEALLAEASERGVAVERIDPSPG